MLASLLAVLAVLTARGRFDDPDMWWNLKTGEMIWTTHTIPTRDLFSFTALHHSLIPQEWLSQLLIYVGYRFGGYSGIMLWLSFFTAVMFIAGYALCSLYSGNAKVGFLGAMILWFFSTSGFAVRAQVIGYVFLVLELLLVHLGRTRSARWFLFLPPLFVLWVNCHGSFFFGLVVLGVFFICSFFDFRMGSLVSQGWDASRRRMLALSLILSGAAVFLNPVGARQVFYPLNTMLHQPLVVSQIDEWKPLVLSSPRGVALLGILGFVFLYLIVQRSKALFLDELLLLAMGAWFAFSHRRMAFAFGILAAPIVSRLLSESWEGYDAGRDGPAPNAAFIAVAALVVFLAFPGHQNLEKQVDGSNPIKAVQFIQTHHLSGNMLNSYVYGGYLIWALPEHPDFIDGRSDLFEWAGIMGQYGEWATLQSDPNTLLDKYDVDFCLLERGSPMVHVLPLLRNWQQVYSDSDSVIFVRSAAQSPST
ncbi:MAG: hypothetical protein WA826_21655 [Silvibacterium sp.]